MLMARARWELLGTSVGWKALMAVSGLVLSGWVFLHMAGNLFVFAGPEVLDGYAAAIQGGPLLWAQRVVTVVAFGVHVAGAAVLTRRARRARQARYRHRLDPQTATPASRSMRWGGLAVGLFLVYHVAHAYGAWHPSYAPGDVYHNTVVGLADPFAGTVYLLATLVFGLHLYHGTWSLFGSLGQRGPVDRALRRATAIFTAVVTLGFLAPVVAALLGLL